MNSVPIAAVHHQALRRLVGIMIPADASMAMPGADDELIFADLLRSSSRVSGPIETVLEQLDELANGAFANLHSDQQQALALRLLDAPPAKLGPELARLFEWVLQCYYRDDRVMRCIGMEVRPPFPKGFEVEQGDWSLLEPVRARQKIYRDAP